MPHASPNTASPGVQLMSGSLDDFPISQVMEVMGLSRQCLRLELHDARGLAAFFVIKSGQVLEARVQSGEQGAAAFGWLLRKAGRGTGHRFIVSHMDKPARWSTPLGTLEQLYAQGQQSTRHEPSAQAASHAVTTLAPPNWQAPSSEHRLGRAADTPQPSAEEPPRLAQIEQTLERINQELQTLHRAPQAAPQTSPHAEQLRSEVQAVLERLERISHSVAALEGRLQSMPQLINAEVRTSLIDQHHQQRGQLDALQRALPTTSDKPQPLLLGMALLQLVCLGLLIWLMTAR